MFPFVITPVLTFSGIVYTSLTAGRTTFALATSGGLPIRYIERSDISAYLTPDDFATGRELTYGTEWTFNSAGDSVVLSGAVAGALKTTDSLLLKRNTDIDLPVRLFDDSAGLTAAALNQINYFIIYVAQEQREKTELAQATANDADSKADAALAALAQARFFIPVADVAAIPPAPTEDELVEVTDSTGIESFQPLIDVPPSFVGSTETTARINWISPSWRWVGYRVLDPDSRYVNLTGDVVTGDLGVEGGLTIGKTGVAGAINFRRPGDGNPGNAIVGYTGLDAPHNINIGLLNWGGLGDAILMSNGGAAAVHSITGPVAFRRGPWTAPIESGRFDTAGRFLIGASTAINFAGAFGSFQHATASASLRVALTSYFGADTVGPFLVLGKSRGTAVGTHVEPANGDTLGNLSFAGSNVASNRFDAGANIVALTAEQWSATGRGTTLTFATTGIQSTVITERMRIDSAGNIGIGTTTPQARVDATINSATLYNTANMLGGGINGYLFNQSLTAGVAATLGFGAAGPGTVGQAAISAIQTGSALADLAFGTRVGTNVSERMRLTSVGQLLIGNSTSISHPITGSPQAPNLQLTGNSEPGGAIGLACFDNASFTRPASINFLRGRGNMAAPAALSGSEFLGSLNFNGWIGTAAVNLGSIVGRVDLGTAPSAANAPTSLRFNVTPSGSGVPVERLRLDGDGLKFAGATAAANALNAYEEGTWTPVLIGAFTLGVGTYTLQNGRYVRIGNMVFVEGGIHWTAHTGTGGMQISGLPFAIPSASPGPSAAIGRFTAITLAANNTLMLYGAPNTSTLPFRQSPVGGGAESQVTITATGQVNFSMSYRTN